MTTCAEHAEVELRNDLVGEVVRKKRKYIEWLCHVNWCKPSATAFDGGI